MQQHLIFSGSSDYDWRIDEHTKQAGRLGIATARATLATLRSEGRHGDEQLCDAA